MSRHIRKLVVAFSLAVAFVPATMGYASGPGSSTVAQVESCLKAGLGTHKTTISLGLAKRCAPAGAQIVKAAYGYSIVLDAAGSPTAGPGTDPCQWHTYNRLGAGYTDWLGVEFCWDGYSSWISGTPQTSCWTWIWSAHCNYSYWTEPMGQWGDGNQVEAIGHYYNTCWWGIECDDTIWMVVAYDGHYYVGSY